MLTQAQRAYLKGEKEYRPSVERDVRKRIRDRLRGSFQDSQLIFQYLPHEDIKTALGLGEDHAVGMPEIATARINMLALIHLSGCLNDGIETGTRGLGNQLERAISMSLVGQEKEIQSVSVDIEAEYSEISEDLTPAEMAKTYSLQQLHDLAAAGTIDDETFAQVWEEIRSAEEPPDEE